MTASAAGSTRATGAACGPRPADRRARGPACWIAAASVRYRGTVCCCRLGPAGYRGSRRRAGHGGSLPVQRRPTIARVGRKRSPTRCTDRHAAEISPASCGVLQPRTRGVGDGSSRRRVSQRGRARGAACNKTRMETQIDTQTDACLRPGSVRRRPARLPRSIGRGTCPEKSRGVRLKSQTDTSWAPNRQEWSSPRPWRPPGSPSPAASRRARSSPPLACAPSCSTSVAAFVKTRLPSAPFISAPGHRAAPGLPSGPFP